MGKWKRTCQTRGKADIKNKKKSPSKRGQASDQILKSNVASPVIDLILPNNPLANPLSPEDQIQDSQSSWVDLGNLMKECGIPIAPSPTIPYNKLQTSSPLPKSRPISSSNPDHC